MGNSQDIVYSTQIPGQQQSPNCTKIRRNPICLQRLFEKPPNSNLETMKDIFLESFKNFSNQPCLGTIVSKQVMKEGKEIIEKQIKYYTYKQLHEKVIKIASAIIQLGLAPQIEEVPGMKMKFIGVYSKNRPEWVILDLVCMLYGFVLVPMYDTLGPENISYVLNHSHVENMFGSEPAIQTLMETADLGRLKTIVSFDKLSPALIEKIKERKLDFYHFEDLLLKETIQASYAKIEPRDCMTFSYTSGTTGPPKAAMLCHRNFASYCAILKLHPDFRFGPEDVYLSYLPLPHVFERLCVISMLFCGARICFYSGDVQKLKDDIDLVKPTFFASVPRLYTRFYEKIKEKFDKTEGFSKTIADFALSSKLSNLKSNGDVQHSIFDKIVFNKTKEAFGGRVKLMISGSAPLLPNVHSFMKVVGCCPILQGYGQTQSTGASFITISRDPNCGHVGGPATNVQFKLVDIPQMGYTHNDKDEQGRSCPRGEICMRGPGIFLGYYKDPQKTKEAVDAEGWLHSGDVGAILPETGALKIIDRKKNIFKLQQGEYVASEKVEAVYLKKSDVVEMFLYGDSMQTYAIAVIQPNKTVIQEIAKIKNIEGNFEILCQHKEIRQEFLTRLNKFSKSEGLQGFEQPKNVYLQTEPFLSKGILTNTMKLQRHEAKKVYKTVFENLYKQGMLVGAEKK